MKNKPMASPTIDPVQDPDIQPLSIAQETRRTDRATQRFVAFVKKFLVFMISHVGLTCLVIIYSIMGGFIFMKLEATQELATRAVLGEVRQMYAQKLWNLTMSLNILSESRWITDADEIFKEFQSDVYRYVKDKGWDGSDSVTDEVKEWTYAGSLLYSVTVITTIGFGHLTPRTLWGRVVTMLYAVVGIPLTLLCLTNIGSFMAQMFRLFWKQVLCRSRVITKPAQRDAMDEKPQPETMDVSCGNDVTTMSASEQKRTEANEPYGGFRILACLFLMIGYICLGALMFTVWEQDWTYLDGVYFCFVTLSTIGFGDLVPGHGHGSWHNQAKRISCTLYLLFGLALISMCFDLIQRELRGMCRSVHGAVSASKENSAFFKRF